MVLPLLDCACVVMAAPGSEMEVGAAAGPEELVCARGRNRKAVLCQRCGSRVLLPGTATFARREVGSAEAPSPGGEGRGFSVCRISRREEISLNGEQLTYWGAFCFRGGHRLLGFVV